MKISLADGEKADVNPTMCMREDLENLSSTELKGCMAGLLGTNMEEKEAKRWSDRLNATDPENLTIGIDRDKANHFKFLGSETKWRSMGKWLDPKTGDIIRDKNYQIEVLFRDNEKEQVGERLMELTKEFNKKEVGEKLLFAKTNAVEETTLF